DMAGSPERIHADANRDLANGNYPGAIQKLELLEARFPFTEPARQGQIDLIYAYYKNREAESAIDQADQFIRENPTHPRVDYAYYVKGLVYYESGANALERLFRADITKRPPQEARKSFQAFQTLIQQYPKSPYAADARQRMVYLRNRLADYEIHVARYYMRRGAYVGALNRARNLIETYDGSPAVTEALEIGAKAYRQLGMYDVAALVDKVRAENRSPDLVSPSAAMAGLAVGPASGGLAGGSGAGGGFMSGAALRDERWEARVGLSMANTADVDFKGGTTAEIDGGLGFLFGVGYHYTENLQFGSTFTLDQKDYEAEVAGDQSGESFTAKGSLDTMSLMVDVAYNFLTGPFTPFVAGSVGWSWVDTNIATEPPTVGCWWHPWYGYICTSWQDTRTADGLAYELGVGARYDFSDRLAADGSYSVRWVDFENAEGSPTFDSLRVNLIWKF
ncbi:MAG: outer membrane protein assembly factor BamD, partial [Steroidobacteraceae bacterium]|nr:outer membrane protein assembly factor BamD [Steroidobacteraceae bacterium]